MKILCSAKVAGHKRPYIVGFHSYEMSRTGKSMETESRNPWCLAWAGERGVVVNWHGVSFWGGKKVLKLDGRDAYTTL